MPVAFGTHPRFVDHLTGAGHPERADRLRAIAAAVRLAGLIGYPNPFGELKLAFGPLPQAREKLLELPLAPPADERWIQTLHTREQIESVRQACESERAFIDEDTVVCRESFEIAKLAVGTVLGCCDAVIDGRATRAFAAVRPPGHHAEPQRAMGFCLFGNVAIAARYLQQQHGVGRIAIVDFDVHHGNGTQKAFEADPTVLFISLHQNPRTCYPGTGYASEIGSGAGAGFTLNVPLDPGAGDGEYVAAMEQFVLPALERFSPEFLLVSAGFDAHRDDPLAQIALSEEGFRRITALLAESADRFCGGKMVSVLEGGYDLRALGRSVVQHLMGMM
jgi:acetoin utilization deacetylase AcuC-like enzyme